MCKIAKNGFGDDMYLKFKYTAQYQSTTMFVAAKSGTENILDVLLKCIGVVVIIHGGA